jgi:hypothetical protein
MYSHNDRLNVTQNFSHKIKLFVCVQSAYVVDGSRYGHNAQFDGSLRFFYNYAT